MINQVAHLCLKPSQLEPMTAFYRAALGATVKFRYLNKAGEPIRCYFAFGGNTFIEVFDHADAHRRSNSPKPLEPLEEPRDAWLMRHNHFCLQVEGLDAFVALIESRGVTETGRKTGNDRSHQAWVKDPDGSLIELQEYTAESRQFTGKDYRENQGPRGRRQHRVSCPACSRRKVSAACPRCRPPRAAPPIQSKIH